MIILQSLSLRSAILNLSPSSVEDQESLLHLKHLAPSLDYALSGYGYFKLNRASITSVGSYNYVITYAYKARKIFYEELFHFNLQILSAVITYNVVLVQFQNANLKSGIGIGSPTNRTQ